MKVKWAIGVGFWVLLYASVKLLEQHAWIGPLSALLMWLFVVTMVINYGIEILRSRGASGKRTVSRTGYPRWLLRFAYDEDRSNALATGRLQKKRGVRLGRG
jgi:hypothetical protein